MSMVKHVAGIKALQGASAVMDDWQCPLKLWHRHCRACDIIESGPLGGMAMVRKRSGLGVEMSFQENNSEELLHAGDSTPSSAYQCTSIGYTYDAWHQPWTLALLQYVDAARNGSR
jgi:hypothetical protein